MGVNGCHAPLLYLGPASILPPDCGGGAKLTFDRRCWARLGSYDRQQAKVGKKQFQTSTKWPAAPIWSGPIMIGITKAWHLGGAEQTTGKRSKAKRSRLLVGLHNF